MDKIAAECCGSCVEMDWQKDKNDFICLVQKKPIKNYDESCPYYTSRNPIDNKHEKVLDRLKEFINILPLDKTQYDGESILTMIEEFENQLEKENE